MAQVKTVRGLARGLSVLKQVGRHPGMTLQQLHARTGLAKATLLRLLRTLEEQGWIYCSLAEGTYWVSANLRNLAGRVEPESALAELAGPILERLCHRVVWPSDLAVCTGQAMMIVETSRRSTPFLVNRDVFRIRPHMLKSALGRAYLAFCPEDERAEILERLRRSDDPDDRGARNGRWVRDLIADTRRRGFGMREPGYWAGLPGFENVVHAIAVPVVVGADDGGGTAEGAHVAGCINLLWVAGTIEVDDFAARHLPLLRAAAAELAAKIHATAVDAGAGGGAAA
jgi:IclR family mhp operon transcriptional activator